MRRIASNICFDHLRSSSRRPSVVEMGDAGEMADPERIERRVEQQMTILGTLNEIRPQYGEALFMRVVEGLSHDEMATRLDISPAQAKSLVHRARCSFKERWPTG